MCYVLFMGATSGPGTGVAKRIGVRELRQHASLYVDLAEKGYTVDITNRGRLVARLVPVSEPESPLERLFAAGILKPAEDPGDLLDIEPGPPVPPGRPTASEILNELREDRL
jgi:prevent-host-death family protein